MVAVIVRETVSLNPPPPPPISRSARTLCYAADCIVLSPWSYIFQINVCRMKTNKKKQQTLSSQLAQRYVCKFATEHRYTLIHKTYRSTAEDEKAKEKKSLTHTHTHTARQIECRRFFFIIRLQQWMVHKFYEMGHTGGTPRKQELWVWRGVGRRWLGNGGSSKRRQTRCCDGIKISYTLSNKRYRFYMKRKLYVKSIHREQMRVGTRCLDRPYSMDTCRGWATESYRRGGPKILE